MSAKTFLDERCDFWPYGVEATNRDWFIDVLMCLCEEGEGFDGKRPNCEAGWQRNLEAALRRHETRTSEVVAELFGLSEAVDRLCTYVVPDDRTVAALKTVLAWASHEETPRVDGIDDLVMIATKTLDGDEATVSTATIRSARRALPAFGCGLINGNPGGTARLRDRVNDHRHVERLLDDMVLGRRAW